MNTTLQDVIHLITTTDLKKIFIQRYGNSPRPNKAALTECNVCGVPSQDLNIYDECIHCSEPKTTTGD